MAFLFPCFFRESMGFRVFQAVFLKGGFFLWKSSLPSRTRR
jgi:hypothetical protein